MPIINIEIMKTIDERQMQKTIKEKQAKTKRSNPLDFTKTEAMVKRYIRAK